MASTAEFCDDCGSILPQVVGFSEKIVCYCCKRLTQVRTSSKVEYRIVFNQKPEEGDPSRLEGENDQDEGPVVERVCPKCGCDKMSYATLQLRSADEGQTVFFTCVKCK